MALLQSCPSSLPTLKLPKRPQIPKPSVPQIRNPNAQPIASVPIKLRRDVQPMCCSTSLGSPAEPDEALSSGSAVSVFVKGLSKATTERRLFKAFSQFGEVTRVQIMVDKQSKQSLGYGFVWFTREESVQTAVEEMNGKVYSGQSGETWMEQSPEEVARTPIQVLK